MAMQPASPSDTPAVGTPRADGAGNGAANPLPFASAGADRTMQDPTRRETRPAAPAHSPSTTNVGDVERVASALAGAACVTWGLRRRSLGGLLVAAAGGELLYRGFSGHCRFYQWLGKSTVDSGPTHVETAITIGRPAEELYRLWRDPQALSRIMGHFADVEARGEGRLHWTVRGPLEQRLQWDSETIDEHPGESLRWRSCAGAPVPNEGELRFAPAPQERGTEVRFRLRFDPPGGVLGRAAVKALGSTPSLIAGHALRRFKSLAETGEIPTLERNPSAREGVSDAED